MRPPGWYRTGSETVASGCARGTVRRWWDGRLWTRHVRLVTDVTTRPPEGGAPTYLDATEVIRVDHTKGFFMRRIVTGLAVLATAAGIGFGVTQLANAETAPSPSAASGMVRGALVAIPANGARGWYIDANGRPQFLPKGPNAIPGKPGDYRDAWFKGDSLATGGGVQGAKGEKGDPGNSAVKVARKSVKLDVNSPAKQTVKVEGVIAATVKGGELWGSNAEAAPDGATVTVTPLTGTAAPDGLAKTERAFLVEPTGFTGTKTLTLDVWVLTVVP